MIELKNEIDIINFETFYLFAFSHYIHSYL